MEVDPERVSERYREKEIARQRLATVVEDSPTITKFIEENVNVFNGTQGDPQSFNLLDVLLNEQVYRLAYWRVASEEINYRRFFDINDLAAIRMEDEAVLMESHAFIFRLLKEGALTGLRIDHVDGLYDPERYLRHMQAWAQTELSPHPRHQDSDEDRPLYTVVEKILGRDEPLPRTWPVHGTTGYDFLGLVNGLFVQSANEAALDHVYTQFIHRHRLYDDLVYETKNLIMRVSMSSDINVLGHHLNRLSERDRRSRDLTLNSLTHAIREIMACFPVYRTYVTDSPEPVLDGDRAYIRLAVASAKRRNPAVSGLVFDFVRSLLLKEWDERTQQDRKEQLRFVMKFQQTTSPVAAKGVEDTAFYVYNRLLSLNEVGSDPQRFGMPLTTFHQHMRERQAYWPHSMSATSTHDTKRSEDVRARLNVLSEIPQWWRTRVNRWGKVNKRHKTAVDGEAAPDRNEEYCLYQILIGAWPLGLVDEAQYRTFCDRIQAYMNKALREAKVHTSWLNPHQGYEEAVHHFVEGILDRTTLNPFLEDFRPFQARIAQHGMCNALSQLLLKVTAPGIPDFYQGTELWDLSLVDPDNRRPVDFSMRAKLLNELERTCMDIGEDRRGFVRDLITSRTDGMLKLYVTRTALHYRQAHACLFQRGEYVPLDLYASKRDHVCAFTRLYQDEAAMTVVPRLVADLMQQGEGFPVRSEVWGDTLVRVPSWRQGGQYRNVLTGEVLTSSEAVGNQVLRVGEILSDCPVALLERIA
jgi:(1->4)-alpha-D-glucan 1-alpha-D-glucosylmutase